MLWLWQLRTTQPTGLILYSGHRDVVDDDDDDSGRTDFIAIELLDGRLRYVFDVGSGVRVIRDRLQRPLDDNRWHEVNVRRTLPRVIFTARRECIARTTVARCLFVWLSHAGIVWKRLYISSEFLHSRVATHFSFSIPNVMARDTSNAGDTIYSTLTNTAIDLWA